MAPVPNPRLYLNEVPTGLPVPGKTTRIDSSQTIDLETVPLNGGYLIKVLYLSADPYQRSKMKADPTNYSGAYTIGGTLDNFGVGEVIRSETDSFKVGDHVYGMLPFQSYEVVTNPEQYKVLNNPVNIPWHTYIGVAGMPGFTAYAGWKLWVEKKVKKGDVLFVTTAAGPVGCMVVQLAKRAGLKVIGSAGTEKKVEYLKSIGTDVAFNYKTADVAKILKEHGPIDVYWDHVGGEQLDHALTAMAINGIIISCGFATTYNGESYGVKNFSAILYKTLTVYGLLQLRWEKLLHPQFYEEIPPLVASGEVKFLEHFYHGLEGAEQAMLDVQTGDNIGKAVIVLGEDSKA
ncbi:alcohol dehydrogenase [Sistotremastrum suecicum HHB10207 ss-3]|uniref:Alcohol dehydrogenase n=1 Tax=Sistotremastrum suecicum HHB10207 ss-3 TaxID=1314776 RepID=A0A166HD00_9AGAM|nr:alcohol dehydrogenase [Sistotremastrum suecicum HHB10207 ss-3]